MATASSNRRGRARVSDHSSRVSIPLAIALVAGSLAAWLVFDYTRSSGSIDGARRAVLVAATPISSGRVLSEDDLPQLVRQRIVPEAYVPADAVNSETELVGTRIAVDVSEGAYITGALLVGDDEDERYRLRRNERAVSIDVRTAPDGAELIAGSIIDLIASGFDGAPQSEIVLRDVEVLQSVESTAEAADARLTVRVAVAQVAAVVRADVFARELRAVKQ